MSSLCSDDVHRHSELAERDGEFRGSVQTHEGHVQRLSDRHGKPGDHTDGTQPGFLLPAGERKPMSSCVLFSVFKSM